MYLRCHTSHERTPTSVNKLSPEPESARHPNHSGHSCHTWRDGLSISLAILRLFALERPFRFFLGLGIGFFLVATVLFAPVLGEYLRTGLVPRMPTLVVAVGGYALAFVSPIVGLVLHAISVGRREARRLAWLAQTPRRNG